MEYKLRNSIGFRFNTIGNRIHAMFSKAIEPYGIAPEQFAAMKMISEDGAVTQSKIAEMLAKAKPTVSRTLDALEKKGLITRDEDTADRRIKYVRLTDAGRKVLDEVIPIAKSFNDAIYEQLTPQEIETFFRILETISNTVEQCTLTGDKHHEI
ncbi:MarR family transcriptional regulator [Sulfurimonas sp. HSL3-7]|uniref:MarR family winged helix-turn-helix transcriptional regulator n=1 Tax=Sulfonitrofixus jiaomeiensis TaxID=3131938 RepID=UPI0031F7DE6C